MQNYSNITVSLGQVLTLKLYHSGLISNISLHTKLEYSMTIYAIFTGFYGQMLHLLVALNPKEVVGNISVVLLFIITQIMITL